MHSTAEIERRQGVMEVAMMIHLVKKGGIGQSLHAKNSVYQ